MHDTIIRGGTIVDGTGAAPFVGDIAIRGGKIVDLGSITDRTRETIDADGAVVVPGFVDIHTHYDGQFLWDDEIEPSFSNGVTTAIAGNCGVGFAPVNLQYRSQLIEMMEGVEDIPGIVLDEGLNWDWKSFPDYLDRLDERSYTMDVASHLPQAPLRVFAMGERALAHEKATVDDIAAMQQLVREAMMAGAIGVSGSRILEHLSSKGDHVPGTFAQESEMIALARAMGESGRGTFQMAPLGAGGDTMGIQASVAERIEEHARMERLAQASGRPVTYILHSYNHDPEEWRTMIDASARANAKGLQIVPQIAARGLGLILGLDTFHVFQCRPSYMAIAHLPRAQRAAAMRDPERRRAILSEANVPVEQAPDPRTLAHAERCMQVLERCYVLTDPLDYEPAASAQLGAIGADTGKTAEQVFYDVLSEGEGQQMVANFVMNYVGERLDSVYEMIRSPLTVAGMGDGGAHLLMICDAAMTTFNLSFWSRDRSRGPILPLEQTVHKVTGKPAALYGLSDRGIIVPGRRADINVIDFARLGNKLPEVTFDLPKGSGRLIQRGEGYLATLVNGVVTRRNDEATGTRPGRLVRSGVS